MLKNCSAGALWSETGVTIMSYDVWPGMARLTNVSVSLRGTMTLQKLNTHFLQDMCNYN